MSTESGETRNGRDPWLVPPEHRPTCPVSGEPCTSWTCLVDVCVDTAEHDRIVIVGAVAHPERPNVHIERVLRGVDLKIRRYRGTE